MLQKYRYEYWPWYLFFLPLIPVFAVLIIWTRKLLYFTAVNPAIEMGGVFGESKINILNQIPEKYKPKTIFKAQTTKIEDVDLKEFTYPLIIKPNVGERGNGIKLCKDYEELKLKIEEDNVDFIIQEYIETSIELGILYYKMPQKGISGISSVTQKKFMQVVGNGKSTVEELMGKNVRSSLQIERLQAERPDLLTCIPEKDEILLLEPRGNHCLGTEFVNANHMITHDLVSVFDAITRDYQGFNFGRFDLKVSSWEDLYAGTGMHIFELNGVTSEPGHIYDKNYNLFSAYRDVAKQMLLVAQIAKLNLKEGVKPTKFRELASQLWKHFSA